MSNGVIELKQLTKAILLLLLLGIHSKALAVDYFDVYIDNPVQAGAYFAVTIYAMNADTSPDGSYTGTVSFEVSPQAGTISPAASSNFVGGAWSTNLMRIMAADDNTVFTCRDMGGTTATGTATTDVNPGTGNGLILVLPGQNHTPGTYPGVSPSPVNLIEGTFHPLTVYVVDSLWNWDDTFSGTTVTVSAIGTSILPNAEVYTENGRANFSISFSQAGFLTVTGTTYPPSSFSNTTQAWVTDAEFAWSHILAPSQVTAGVPFTLGLNVSTSPADPNLILTSFDGPFRLNRFIWGTSNPATGNWGGGTDLPVVSGQFSASNFTYDRAEEIYFGADNLSGGSVVVTGINSTQVVVLPNTPQSIQASASPANIQAGEAATINATILDLYGNATRSSLHPFDVHFEMTTPNGSLDVTQTATDDTGQTSVRFTAGNENEQAQILISVRNTLTYALYAQQTVTVNVSVARAEVGAILNFPNPFNPTTGQTTSVNFYMEESSDIELRIYDSFGRLVISEDFKRGETGPVAQNATRAGGAYWEWDGKNGEGRTVSNGIYLLVITAKGSNEIQEFKRRVGVLK